MSNDTAFDDASIPVLTEVVYDTPAVAGEAPAAEPQAAAEPVPVIELVIGEDPAVATVPPAGPDWDALEQRLCERILQQLQGQVDIVVEKRLREGMADVMQHVLAGLTDEIHTGLRHAVEQVVAREVAHIRTHDA
jgi:hypothetical protein